MTLRIHKDAVQHVPALLGHASLLQYVMRPLRPHMVSTALHVGTVLALCVRLRGNEEKAIPTRIFDSKVSETISYGYSDNLVQPTGEELRTCSAGLITMRAFVRRRLPRILENARSCLWIGLLTTLSFHLHTYLGPRRCIRAPCKTHMFTARGLAYMLSMGTVSTVIFPRRPCRPRSYLACRPSSLQDHIPAHSIRRGNKSSWRAQSSQPNAAGLE